MCIHFDRAIRNYDSHPNVEFMKEFFPFAIIGTFSPTSQLGMRMIDDDMMMTLVRVKSDVNESPIIASILKKIHPTCHAEIAKLQADIDGKYDFVSESICQDIEIHKKKCNNVLDKYAFEHVKHALKQLNDANSRRAYAEWWARLQEKISYVDQRSLNNARFESNQYIYSISKFLTEWNDILMLQKKMLDIYNSDDIALNPIQLRELYDESVPENYRRSDPKPRDPFDVISEIDRQANSIEGYFRYRAKQIVKIVEEIENAKREVNYHSAESKNYSGRKKERPADVLLKGLKPKPKTKADPERESSSSGMHNPKRR